MPYETQALGSLAHTMAVVTLQNVVYSLDIPSFAVVSSSNFFFPPSNEYLSPPLLELIDVTFVSMIVAAGCWFIAMFGTKPEPKSRKNKNKDADVESVILNYDNPHKQQATITIIQEEFNPDQGKRVSKDNKRNTMETRPSDRTVVDDENIEFLDEKEYKA
jgi:hypothetical protein